MFPVLCPTTRFPNDGIFQSYSVAYLYAKINNLRQHLHRMVLLENNVTRRLRPEFV
jgi:hypothetical protein